MIKIQKTIDNCQDCEFSLIYERNGSNALICGGVDFDEERRSSEFLILIANNVKHFKSDIPNNCPLENYEPKTECK